MERRVNLPDIQKRPETAADLLDLIRNKGVRLWSTNGQLHYKAPKGALGPQEIERLRLSKGQLVTLLAERAAVQTAASEPGPGPQLERLPLAFSQQAHWNLYGLDRHPSFSVALFAVRIRGRLNLQALRRSLVEIVRRHSALRTRIVMSNTVPTQVVMESCDCEPRLEDLTALPEEAREPETKRQLEDLIWRPIEVSAGGPLLEATLLRLHDDHHVLALTLEHIISDGFSMNVLAREFSAAYRQALKGEDFQLPAVRLQFCDYALWQRHEHRSWLEKHGTYWTEQTARYPRLRFPRDDAQSTSTRSGWGFVPFRLDSRLVTGLREWCRIQRTTLVMSVFTAYTALVLRWCNASEALFAFETDGRTSPMLEDAMGYFASALYIGAKITDEDDFVALLSRVTEAYCSAYEHADSSYLEAQVPRPEFTRNCLFNWIPQGSGSDPLQLAHWDDGVSCSRFPIAPTMPKRFERDTEPIIAFIETDTGIRGTVQFSRSRHSDQAMERFARNIPVFIEALLGQGRIRVKDVRLQ
jgi:Condensation domain/TubC N-terminal docking domain